MSRLRVQAILLAANDKREDDVMNVWHFQTAAAVDEGSLSTITGALNAFYPAAFGTRASPSRSGEITLRVFDLADPQPRSPIHEITTTPGMSNDSGQLPAELAVCLSFRAQNVSGQPKGRRRGRLYIGPWGSSANSSSTGRVNGAVQASVLAAAGALWDATTGNVSESVTWEIYSPTDDLMHEVARVFVDDAWDIQRRRGVDPLDRVSQIFTAD